MTREEASIIIGNIPINGDGCYSISEYQQAKAMAIEALEQKEKTGKWIEKWDSDHLVILAYECSKCGMMMNVNTSHYCPNCGARMQEVEKNG